MACKWGMLLGSHWNALWMANCACLLLSPFHTPKCGTMWSCLQTTLVSCVLKRALYSIHIWEHKFHCFVHYCFLWFPSWLMATFWLIGLDLSVPGSVYCDYFTTVTVKNKEGHQQREFALMTWKERELQSQSLGKVETSLSGSHWLKDWKNGQSLETLQKRMANKPQRGTGVMKHTLPQCLKKNVR